jgi:DNA-binding transcriptional LysR family regulator
MALAGPDNEVSFGGGAVLEVDLLRTLVAIVSTGSFNRAAKAVFRTPSAVSMQMKKLEDLVGRAIFAKDGRGVVLTTDGEALLGYARRMLQLNDEALARFRCQATEGVVRLGTPDDYATVFLPRILGRFAASHPLVQVDVNCLSSSKLIGLLDQGELDIALVSRGASGHGEGVLVHREPLVWAGLRHGTAWQRRPMPIAVSSGLCCWRSQSTAALDRVGVDYRVAYTSQHYVGQLAPVLADLAVAPLPASLITGDLVRVDDRGLPPIGHYEIELRVTARPTGPALDALAEHIRQSFASEPLATMAA